MPGNLERTLDKVCIDFKINDASCLITQNGEVLYQHNAIENKVDTAGFNKVIVNFSAPILLDQLINDSTIKENLRVNKILGLVTKESVFPRDLITVPANIDEPGFQDPDSIAAATYNLMSRIKGKTAANFKLTQFIKNELAITAISSTKQLLQDLAAVSSFFDKRFPEYHSSDTLINNPAPTWYTQNINRFYGWNVLKLNRNTILWNYFKLGKKSILLIKLMDKNIFMACSYTSAVAGPYDYNRKDLLQSPLAIAMLKALLIGGSNAAMDYNKPSVKIYNILHAQVNNPYYVIYIKELLSYARLYNERGNKKMAVYLYLLYDKISGDPALIAGIDKTSITGIDYVSDNMNAVIPFKIDKPTVITVLSAGQAMATTDLKAAPYQYDNIQFFFNKNINPHLIKQEDNCLFSFNYKNNKVYTTPDEHTPDGWLNDNAVQFAFNDTDDTTYVMEVKIPWDKLKCGRPKVNNVMSMNFFVGESGLQENQRETILSWMVKNGENWNDPTKYGKLILSDHPRENMPGVNYCIKTNKAPIIDGIQESVWGMAGFSSINLSFQGNPAHYNNSARFKTLYDNNYLYFLFDVTDNCKNPPDIITRDKCWIEDAQTGTVIWKMNGLLFKGSPSFYITKKLGLKKGNYKLRYTSDKGNSFDSGWYGKPPVSGFYGVSVYKVTENNEKNVADRKAN